MKRAITTSILLLVAGSRIAFAQPATQTAPMATNPANTIPGAMTPEQKAEAEKQAEAEFDKMPAQMKAMMKMTPEQQQEEMRKIYEQLLRMTLDRAGFKDVKLQDTVAAFVAEQEKSRDAVRQAAAKVYLALEPRGNPTDKQVMTFLMVNYLNAVDDAKEARETATKALDKTIKFSENPQLMATLTLSGIIGDAAWFTGNIIMTGTMSAGALAPFMAPARGPVLAR